MTSSIAAQRVCGDAQRRERARARHQGTGEIAVDAPDRSASRRTRGGTMSCEPSDRRTTTSSPAISIRENGLPASTACGSSAATAAARSASVVCPSPFRSRLSAGGQRLEPRQIPRQSRDVEDVEQLVPRIEIAEMIVRDEHRSAARRGPPGGVVVAAGLEVVIDRRRHATGPVSRTDTGLEPSSARRIDRHVRVAIGSIREGGPARRGAQTRRADDSIGASRLV